MGKASSGASLASAKPFLPRISPPPRTPRLAGPEAQADPGPRRAVATRPGAWWCPWDGGQGTGERGQATRGHKYDRNTSPQGGTSAVQQSQRSPKTLSTPTSKKCTPSTNTPSPGGPGPRQAELLAMEIWVPLARQRGVGPARSHLDIAKGCVQRPSVLLSFPSPSSPERCSGRPSPLLQPPPLSLRLLHQTKHHLSGKQLPEAALLEQVSPCPPANRHCHILLPVCHTASPTCGHFLCGLAVLDAGWGSQSSVSRAVFLLPAQ